MLTTDLCAVMSHFYTVKFPLSFSPWCERDKRTYRTMCLFSFSRQTRHAHKLHAPIHSVCSKSRCPSSFMNMMPWPSSFEMHGSIESYTLKICSKALIWTMHLFICSRYATVFHWKHALNNCLNVYFLLFRSLPR